VFELEQEARGAEFERVLDNMISADLGPDFLDTVRLEQEVENASKRPRVGTAGLNMDGPIFGTGEVCDVSSVLDLEQLSVF
jgi:hypothetical protein